MSTEIWFRYISVSEKKALAAGEVELNEEKNLQ